MINVTALTKKYRGREGELAVNHLTAPIRLGSITAILGPNGSGKTTLLRMLAGQLEPTSGEVSIGERRVSTDQRIPYFAIAHEGNNFGELKPKDYVAFARTRPRWQQHTYVRLMERFEIPARRALHKLSTGQQSGFAITCALASGAPIVVIDEAHAGMDVPKRLALYEELVRANAEDARTILVSSHNVGELERVAEDVLILRHGELMAQTTADELASRFARVIGPASAVDQLVGTRSVASQRSLGTVEELVVDVSGRPIEQSLDGTVVTSVDFQDAFVALLEGERGLPANQPAINDQLGPNDQLNTGERSTDKNSEATS